MTEPLFIAERRNTILELRLVVQKAKLAKLRVETECLVELILRGIDCQPTTEALKEHALRLRAILYELENEAPNLHQ
jgi:hypothetical protein